MNKLLILAFLFLTITLVDAYALEEETTPQVTTPTSKPETSPTQKVTDKIQELKDRVASRVAALKKGKIAALKGSIKSASNEALILISKDNEYSVQLDEDAKVYSIDENLRKKEIELGSLAKDQQIVVIGSIDSDKKSVVARLVVMRTPNLSIVGRVASVSTKDGTVTVVGNDEKTYIVDIEITTKSNIYNFQKGTFNKIGLSKIEEGVRVHVYATAGKEENRVTALRLLILPNQTSPSLSPQPSPTKSTPTKEPSPTSSE